MRPTLFGPIVQPVTPDPSDAARAAGLGSAVRLGTSSWTFPGWQGLVWGHPVTASQLASEGLAAYAASPLRRCVGVDRTYYGPVGRKTLRAWAEAVPEDFRFVVKASRQLTTPWDDAGRWLDPSFFTEEVLGPTAEALGDHCGPVVLQFPPFDPTPLGGPNRFAEALHRFLGALPRVRPPIAVEIRTRALFTQAYADALKANNASHVISVYPGLPLVSTQGRVDRATGAHHLVVRWMLRPNLEYTSAKETFSPFDRLVAPDPENRDAIAELVRAGRAAGRPVWVVINNKAEGSAPLSIQALANAVLA